MRFFTDLVDLLGASLTPVTCWIIPIVIYLQTATCKSNKVFQVSTTEKIVIGIELVMSFVVLVARARAVRIFGTGMRFFLPLSGVPVAVMA